MLVSIVIGGILGAFGGLIGAGVAHLLMKATGGETVPKWPSVLGVVLAVALTRPISDYVNRPTPDTIMQNLEQREPAYIALKTKQPAVYAEMKAVVAASLVNGEDPTILRGKMRQIVSRLYAEKLPKATDANLILAIGVIRDEAAAIGQTNSTLCVAMLSQKGADISSFLPAELQKRDQEMMNKVVNDDKSTGGATVSQADLESFLMKAVQSISKDLNVPVPNLGSGPIKSLA